MKKNLVLCLVLGIINLIVGTLLTVFVVPNQIPVLFDINEKIVALSSKWLLLFMCITPFILSLVACIISKKYRTFILRALVALFTYENMLIFIYFCLEKNLNIGSPCTISMSLFIFLPLALVMMIAGSKIKFEPYKSKFGLKMKYTLETEFLWKQTHYYARDVLFFVGFALFIISIVFAFFRVSYIEIPIFVIAIIFCILRIRWYAKSMHSKYIEMKTRQENKTQTNLSKESSNEKS